MLFTSMYKRFNKGRVSVVRGRHSRRHCYHLFHLFLFSFSKVHRHLLSSEALKAYSLPVRRANKKRRNKKRSLEGRGYGICRWRGLSKISSMIGLDFHIPVFLESLGGSCFYIPKNFTSPIIIILMIILSSVFSPYTLSKGLFSKYLLSKCLLSRVPSPNAFRSKISLQIRQSHVILGPH